ncbi:hypothetical protein [Sphingomonas quercus]|uniref:Uncharacterized protein n=1 Tax=Sphingomonas quercus TaxID=2842451 RepID=A0ABS6BKY4_9SPHN|nr:hypothetical protein [Sphingomonas quercus]MBU3077890.1 hypothetical protein [Sphingomonas quercus]
MRRPLIALAALAIVASAAAFGSNIAIEQVWDGRLKDHQAQFAELDRAAQGATSAFMAAHDGGATIGDAETGGVYNATQVAAGLDGRRQMLAAWVGHMKGRPSAKASLAWLADHAASLDSGMKSLALSETNLKATIASDPALLPFNVVIGLNRLFEMEAFNEGAAVELHLIAHEAASYYGPAAAAAATRWETAFGSIAETLQRQQSALHSWGRTCRQTAQSTRCDG